MTCQGFTEIGVSGQCRSGGFTLLEIMIALAVVAILAAIAYPSYQDAIERSRTTQTIADINRISAAIERFHSLDFSYPDSLAEVTATPPVDPWGNAYEYLRIDGGNIKGKGKLRKDKNLVPINSDFDLYSKGPDGRSVSPLTAKHSRDDIIRAGNGGFTGVAEDF